MLDWVLDSAIPLHRLKWGTRHNDNGGKRVKFGQLLLFSCLCFRFGSTIHDYRVLS